MKETYGNILAYISQSLYIHILGISIVLVSKNAGFFGLQCINIAEADVPKPTDSTVHAYIQVCQKMHEHEDV